jgi:hypothetical protein
MFVGKLVFDPLMEYLLLLHTFRGSVGRCCGEHNVKKREAISGGMSLSLSYSTETGLRPAKSFVLV